MLQDDQEEKKEVKRTSICNNALASTESRALYDEYYNTLSQLVNDPDFLSGAVQFHAAMYLLIIILEEKVASHKALNGEKVPMNPPLNQLRNGLVHGYFAVSPNHVKEFVNKEVENLRNNSCPQNILQCNLFNSVNPYRGGVDGACNKLRLQIQANQQCDVSQATNIHLQNCYSSGQQYKGFIQQLQQLQATPGIDLKLTQYAILHSASVCLGEAASHVALLDITRAQDFNELKGLRNRFVHAWQALPVGGGAVIFNIATDKDTAYACHVASSFRDPQEQLAFVAQKAAQLQTLIDNANSQTAALHEKQKAEAAAAEKEKEEIPTQPKKQKKVQELQCKPETLKKSKEDDDKDQGSNKSNFTEKPEINSFSITPKSSSSRGGKSSTFNKTGSKGKQARIIKEIIAKGKNNSNNSQTNDESR